MFLDVSFSVVFSPSDFREGVALVRVVDTGVKFASGVSGDDDGEIFVGVAIGIRKTATQDNHGVVEKRVAIDIFRCSHLLKEVGQLLNVEGIDLWNFLEHVLLSLVVRKLVLAVTETEVSKASVRAIMGEKKEEMRV